MDINTFIKIDLHIFAVLVCAVMLVSSTTLSGKRLLPNRIFRWLIISALVTLIVDLLGVFSDCNPDLYGLSCVVESLLYAIAPVAPSLWVLYVSCHLYQDTRRLRIEAGVLSVPLAINAVLAFLSPVYGVMFTISEQNVFARGPYFFVLCAVSIVPIIYSTAMSIAFRKRQSLSMLTPLILFPLPFLAAAALQIVFYGLSVIWPGVVLGIFIVFISIQARQYTIDHLTGAFNRRQLDSQLTVRIKGAQRGKPFSCIMLDIDNFKAINDEFGHIVGDEALADAARLLRSCIRSDDFLARFAGDEFVILLDMADPAVLEATVARIRACVTEYNQNSKKPFHLDFSVGYEICSASSGVSLDGFMARVDSLMYDDKYSKRELPMD